MEPSAKPQLPYSAYAGNSMGFNNYTNTGEITAHTDPNASSYTAYAGAATNQFMAAVAAAAAAAAYTPQGYPTSATSNPLSLSNMIGTGASSGVGSGVSLNPSSSYANRYQSAYQSYQNQYYHNTGYYQQYPSGQRHTSAFQPASGYGNAPLQQQQALHQQQQSADPFQRMSSHPTRQGTKASPSPVRKSKKRPPSETTRSTASEAKKREEYEKLVKARTDKLLSDGPLFAPLTITDMSGAGGGGGGNASSTSSCGSVGTETFSANVGPSPSAVAAAANAHLLRTVLAEKMRHLLRSMEVREVIQAKQIALESYKRHTDLFAVQQQAKHQQQQLSQLQRGN